MHPRMFSIEKESFEIDRDYLIKVIQSTFLSWQAFSSKLCQDECEVDFEIIE